MQEITLKGKRFQRYIDSQEINQIIKNLAQAINNDYKDKEYICIVVLNGAFMFASDLFKLLEGYPMISFVKYTSYQGTCSSGEIKQLIGLSENLNGKDVLIIEDIVDTGFSMASLRQEFLKHKPNSLEIVSLMFKPNNFKADYHIKYIGKSISNEFIVGYGFDIDGLGRNLKDIYKCIE